MNSINDHELCIFTKQEQEESPCIVSTPSSPSCSEMSFPHSPSAPEILNPDYAIYHVPKGFNVVLVPKPDESTTSSSSSIDDSNNTLLNNNNDDDASSDCAYSTKSGSKPMDIPKPNNNTSVPSNDEYASNIDTPNNITNNTSSSSSLPSSTSNSSTSSRLSAYRKRKADKNYIPRPKNCFMAYREHIKEKFLADNPGLNNKVVSVLAAKMWNNEPESVKEYWRERAKQLKLEHKLKYPDYKFKPQKKKSNVKTPGGTKTSAKNRKKPLDSDKQLVFADDYSAEVICHDTDHDNKVIYPIRIETADEQDELYMHHLQKKALFGHYRASSVESVSSWTSDSTASTPLLSPFTCSPASYSPPIFPFNNNSNTNNQMCRSQSALRYEAGNLSHSQEDAHNGNNNIMFSHHHSASHQYEIDQLNQMYNQMDVNARAVMPVDDGFVLDSSYDESTLRTAALLNQSLTSCSSSSPEMSSTDYDLMAMGHFASPISEEQGFYVDYENNSNNYSNFNPSIDPQNNQQAYSSLAEHYAFALETPRRNSQQMLAEFQNGLRQQELMLQELLD
ncbi:11007_t:CDS:1 [Ambispora gerdemannii]|uniref:11007_t:CDS:1 n=1 Tax=Ambispora gerdemannii TaxID=144530 RepID=A0A9N8ZQX5_9GLOM|nr:11007_t:CDS:1 [Ambispora gerdemannii]